MVMPRSLNEPVGFAPSTLSQTLAPTRSERRGAGTSGVPPRAGSPRGGLAHREVAPVFLNQAAPACAMLRPHAPGVVVAVDDAQHPSDLIDDGRRRRSAMHPITSPSRATWVKKMRRASSPRPVCSMERMETWWSRRRLRPRRARRPVGDVDAQVVGGAQLVGRRNLTGRPRDGAGAAKPERRWRAASMTSPSTALAVACPPAPRP